MQGRECKGGSRKQAGGDRCTLQGSFLSFYLVLCSRSFTPACSLFLRHLLFALSVSLSLSLSCLHAFIPFCLSACAWLQANNERNKKGTVFINLMVCLSLPLKACLWKFRRGSGMLGECKERVGVVVNFIVMSPPFRVIVRCLSFWIP